MKTRQLGKTGPEVSAIGLGCMPMSGIYGASDNAQSVAAIHRAMELGITLLDTADFYGNGSNEELLAKAIAGRRGDVVVATKFGITRDEHGRPTGLSGRPEYVREACEASLKRLNVDTIDLYQQHRVDPETPIEETVGALSELVAEGKVRYLGLSEASSDELRRAAAVHPISSVQSDYSLMERGVEDDVLDTCDDLGVGFLAFTPLMRGILAGSLTPDTNLDAGDARAGGDHFPRVGPEHLAANSRLAEIVKEIASAHDASAAQVALAWLLSRRPWVVPIPGTRRAKYIEDNALALGLQLTEEDENRLGSLAAKVEGDRYGAMTRAGDPDKAKR